MTYNTPETAADDQPSDNPLFDLGKFQCRQVDDDHLEISPIILAEGKNKLIIDFKKSWVPISMKDMELSLLILFADEACLGLACYSKINGHMLFSDRWKSGDYPLSKIEPTERIRENAKARGVDPEKVLSIVELMKKFDRPDSPLR